MGYKKTINIVMTIVLLICSISLTAGMAEAETINIKPNSITSISNLDGDVTAIQDDPNSPDSNWLTARSIISDTDVRGTFTDNTEVLKEGAGLQTVTFRIRKSAGLLNVLNPTANLYVYENRNQTQTLIAKSENIPVNDSIVRSLTFDASSLADKTGSNLEWRVQGISVGLLDLLLAATVEVGAVNFNATLAPFGPPTNLRATQITANSINLEWSRVNQAISYQVKRDGVVVYSGNQTSFSDTGLTDATTYTYEVTAYNGSNYSEPSTITPKTLGILSILVPAIANFPDVTFNSLTENATTHLNSGLYIKNSTGNNMGWHVTVEASQFQESGGRQLPKASLKIKPPISYVKLNGTTSGNPENSITSPTVIDNGSAIKIISAAPGAGEGEYQAIFPEDALALTLDLNALTANELNKTYNSTLSFAIVQGP